MSMHDTFIPDYTGGEWIRAVGIDPGGQTGLVAVLMPPSLDLRAARFIGCCTITSGTSVHDSKAQTRSRLMARIRDQLNAWCPSVIVLEEPSDALPTWGGSKKGMRHGASRGTMFSLGAHFGLALGAAGDVQQYARIATYQVTSAREKQKETKKGLRVTPERIGWMQRREPRPPDRTRVLAYYSERLKEIKSRPADGVLPTLAELHAVEAEDVYMALGVLHFHFDRETGRV